MIDKFIKPTKCTTQSTKLFSLSTDTQSKHSDLLSSTIFAPPIFVYYQCINRWKCTRPKGKGGLHCWPFLHVVSTLLYICIFYFYISLISYLIACTDLICHIIYPLGTLKQIQSSIQTSKSIHLDSLLQSWHSWVQKWKFQKLLAPFIQG